MGLEQAGWTCKGHCEIDKYANIWSYQAMHHKRRESGLKRHHQSQFPKAYQMSIFGQADSLPGCLNGGERRGLYGERTGLFLSLFDSSENEVTINPDGLSLKMLRESFPLAEAGILPLFYVNWPHWEVRCGIRACPISKTTVYPKSREACTLSEILQEEVPEKIFPLRSPGKQDSSCTDYWRPNRKQGSMTQEVFHQLSLLEQED